MTTSRGNRTTVTGSRTAPRKKADPIFSKAAFQRPGEETEDWRDRGLCVGSGDPEKWFSNSRARRAEAVAVCLTCPVMTQCLSWALEADQMFGVWGAMDLENVRLRRRLKADRRRAEQKKEAEAGADVPPPSNSEGGGNRNRVGTRNEIRTIHRIEAAVQAGLGLDGVLAEFGYSSTGNLKDVLRREGRPDLIRALFPGYRTQKEISASCLMAEADRIRRNTDDGRRRTRSRAVA